MLRKNVYLLYPAGYHGNFVKWAIEVSDTDNKTVTKDPINSSNSQQYGGVGTSHNHARIPTHQDLRLHNIWYLCNRPKDYKVYLINTGDQRSDIADQVANLLLQDLTGIVINLHDNDDHKWAAYGRINCVTKWPTFMAVSRLFCDVHENFNPFDCAEDIFFRNFIVEKVPLGSCGRPDRMRIMEHLEIYLKWFKIRNRYQPHEVNLDTYPKMPDLAERFFDFSLEEIMHDTFPEKLQNLLEVADIVDNINMSTVQEVHTRYVDIQPNLQWFKSINDWCVTGVIDQYIASHSIMQAEIIMFMFRQTGISFTDTVEVAMWLYQYNNAIRDQSWPKLDNPYQFYELPPQIKEELIGLHGVRPLPLDPSQTNFAQWKTKTLAEINDIYQKTWINSDVRVCKARRC